jgi:epoxyqueuosine reductase
MVQPASDLTELTRDLKNRAIDLGFPLVGITPAATPGRLEHLHRWLDSGYAGRMKYLEERRQAYAHPSSILNGCRTLVMLGVPYLSDSSARQPMECEEGTGKVARYAQFGVDYHEVIRKRLKTLKGWLSDRQPSALIRGVVDTAPLLEREFAEAAGLGWVGKNTLLLSKVWGSYFFLAALLTDLQLKVDAPHQTNHCGTCTACLDACPTAAFVQPYVLDATRCLSYATIEHPGVVDESLSQQMNGWFFGCDICQEVCPWNRKSSTSNDPTWTPQDQWCRLDLLQVLQLSQEDFDQQFKKTPLGRSKRSGLIRNAILLAGWQRLTSALQPLAELLFSDELMLRASAAWSIGRIGGPESKIHLEQALTRETESSVRSAIVRALEAIQQKA